jgi:transposase-like protein
MTRHNLSNPKCPDCGGITQKLGFHTTRNQRVQRYHCISCGRSFLENTKNVKIEDLPLFMAHVRAQSWRE